MRIARNAETAVQEARLLSQGTRENPIQIDHVHTSWGSQAKTFSCYRCGGTDGHAPNECGAIKSRCNKRKKVRHLHRVCRSKSKADQRKGKKGKEKNHPWRSAAWIRNLAQTGLKTVQMTRVKNLYSPSTMVTVPSQWGLGAILLQDQVNSEHKPIAYISRSLTSTKRRY